VLVLVLVLEEEGQRGRPGNEIESKRGGGIRV
jgi:hypothetical protein